MRRFLGSVLFIFLILAFFVCSSAFVCAGEGQGDKVAVERLVRENAGFTVSWVGVRIESGWAFADAAEKGSDGAWSRSTSLLLKKDGANWKILAKGDPIDEKWQKYIAQMPAKVKKAFDAWNKEHF
ncbi:MAG: hypothetical protein LWY06_20555 [Firmicutes bacterium]|nr:hypothetical protein [Bacillota bacterium]